jgi:V/A-type H+/Na+-transporting ATPase subunit D
MADGIKKVYPLSKVGKARAKTDLALAQKRGDYFEKRKNLLFGAVNTVKDDIRKLEISIQEEYERNANWFGVFADSLFDISTFVQIKAVHTESLTIAGVRVERFEKVEFENIEIDISETPLWADEGIQFIKDQSIREIMIACKRKKLELLDEALSEARSKETLYKEILPPHIENQLQKITGQLADEERLSIGTSKIIVRNRKEAI